MQELFTPQQTEELSSGRLYIMDYTSVQEPQQSDEPREETEPEAVSEAPGETEERDAQASFLTYEDTTEPVYERAVRTVRRTDSRAVMMAVALLGTTIGVITALFFPITGADFMTGIAASAEGGFVETLFRRLGQAGLFLLAEFFVGYFAAGGAIIWSAPFIYGLSAGLSSAGVVKAGGSAWVIAAELVYLLVITIAANTSAELSSLLLRLVSGESASVVTRGRASRAYDLQFAVYLLVILAAAIIEAAVKTM